MPVPELMTWVPSRKRWTRMHRGKRFWVSCRQLGTPETKSDSLHAANDWWKAKQAEIDGAGKSASRVPLPLEDVASASLASRGYSLDAIAKIIERDFVTERLRRLNLSPDVRAAVEALFDDTSVAEPEFVERVVQSEIAEFLADVVAKNKPMPEGFAEQLPPARVQQLERGVKELRGEGVADPDRTIEAHADTWLAMQASLVAAKQMTAARCANNRNALEHFLAYLGRDADVATIDAAKLQGFYLYCLAKTNARREDAKAGWSIAFARDVFSVAKAFIRSAWEQGSVELPKNITSRSFRFGSPAKAVKTWTPDEFQRAVAESPGKLKLALLLMANCAYTQQDISDLRDDEVDWIDGRVIRKRSKTANCENVPTVNYKLWPATFALLRQFRDGGERVLLTESGKPFVRTELIGGKLRKADGFASNFVHVKKRLKLQRSLKQLRKLGATILDGHKDYGRFKSYFLGHSPRTVADRHYAAPSQSLFDEAVEWLGRQLGQFNEEAQKA